MSKGRPQLFRHDDGMRMLRWLMQAGNATQREFMAEYQRLGATGTSFVDEFSGYVQYAGENPGRVILKSGARLLWVGPGMEAWLAATPDDELQLGYEAMERAFVETNDDHFGDWVVRLRAEIDRRAT